MGLVGIFRVPAGQFAHVGDPAVGAGWGRTPLHCAGKSVKLDIVRFVVEDCHCDPFRMKWGDTPLHWAVQRKNHLDVVMFLLSHIPPLKLVNSLMRMKYCWHAQLCQVFNRCRIQYPLEPALKIFVLGNHAAGKNTKYDIEPLTAGIVPVNIESIRL